MSEIVLTAGLLITLFFLLGLGVWVGFALTLTGALGMLLFSNAPIGPIMATTLWGHSHSWALAALPLFILMGEILLRSRLSEHMFKGLAPWLGRVHCPARKSGRKRAMRGRRRGRDSWPCSGTCGRAPACPPGSNTCPRQTRPLKARHFEIKHQRFIF